MRGLRFPPTTYYDGILTIKWVRIYEDGIELMKLATQKRPTTPQQDAYLKLLQAK